jgi:hypothetical protein
VQCAVELAVAAAIKPMAICASRGCGDRCGAGDPGELGVGGEPRDAGDLADQLGPLDQHLRDYAKRQPGCRALMRHYGIGPLTSITILAELGDARRFSSSREAVRYAGLDITVHQSDSPPRSRPPLPTRPPGAALGAVRSSPMRPSARLARP